MYYSFEIIRFENYSHMLAISCEVTFLWFFMLFFGTYSLKVVQIWFVWNEIWHTALGNIYYCFEMVRFENNSPKVEITCKIAFLRFLTVFWYVLA